MKKTFILIIIIFSVFLMACNQEYSGKEISYMEYTRIDYNGGYRNQTKIDLNTNEVLVRGYLDEEVDYEVIHNFDETNEKEFINKIFQSGLFALKDEYKNTIPIIDGGGWNLIIQYTDGSTKISKGSNASPSKIFKEADYAFYNLYGDDFFGYLDSSYKNPPSIDIAIKYQDGNNNISDGSGLKVSNYTWNKRKVDNINNIDFAKENQKYEYDSNIEYKFVLWTANYEYKFNKMIIKSYDINGYDEKTIIECKWFKQKEFNLEYDRIYIITMEFDYGTCEYPFATKINKLG